VDLAGLNKFKQGMEQARQKVLQMQREVVSLQKTLGKKLGLNTAAGKGDGKLSASVAQSMQREQKLAAAVQRTRRETFRAELEQQKLVAAGTRDNAVLHTQALKQQQAAAVLEAKRSKAELERLKIMGIESKQSQSLETHKARLARLETLHANAAQKTLNLQAQQQKTLTATQRIEEAMIEARLRGQRAAARFNTVQAAAKVRSQRADVRHEQQMQKFEWQKARQQVWEANQNKPPAPEGLFGLGGIAPVATGIGAALLGVTEALNYAAERINKRQEQAADTQLFDNTLLAAGNTDAERAAIRKAYIENSQEYGMKIDRNSATQYSNQVQGFRAQGKTLAQAIQLQKEQAQVFRIGALNDQQQYSAALQLGQGYSKDRFMGSDLRPLTDALGTRLTTILYQAIGKALGYKGNKDRLAGFVLQAQHEGQVNGKMIQQGLRDIVSQSSELLERHSHSLDAQAVRVENQKYLQNDSINQSPELIQALGERLTAEQQLIDSAKGLNTAFMNLDAGLARMQTGFFRLLAGKNADGTDKDDVQRANEVGAPYTIEGSAINPSDLTGAKVDSPIKPVNDPVDGFWRRLFGLPNYNEGEANQAMKLPDNFKSSRPISDAIKLDMSGLGQSIADSKLFQGMVKFSSTSPGVVNSLDPLSALNYDASRVLHQAGTATTNVDSHDTTTITAPITINIQASENADPKAIADQIDKGVDNRFRQILLEVRSNQKEVK